VHSVPLKEYEYGDVLFKEGDDALKLYIVNSGEFKVI
jgi:CRP-like cAMP-binding protein